VPDKIDTINTNKEVIFKEAYFKHYDKICYYAFCYLHNKSEAENVVQDVYMDLWEKMDVLQVSNDIKPLLFLMTKWKCLNILRHNKRDRVYKEGKIKHDIDSLSYFALLDESSISLYCNEIESLYTTAVEKMPKKIRETFIISRETNLKYKDIADKQNISIKTVEYRISSAYRILRKYLKDYIKFIIFLI